MPYIRIEGINHSDNEKLVNDISDVIAKVLQEPTNRIWVKCSNKGYWNHIKQIEIIIITIFCDKKAAKFDEMVKEITKLLNKYNFRKGLDVHLVESELYHSFN